jgi:endonuclease YncB( thermonuclease family)
MKRSAKLIAPALLLLSFIISVAAQQPVQSNNIKLVLEGKVIRVHDGDTVTLLSSDGKKTNIRLQGIDAPELKQKYGAESQKNLERMVMNKQVTIVWTKQDKYRRTVGTIMLEGRDVNIEQVKAGLAWHFKKYEEEQDPADRVTYSKAEEEARKAKLGLWQDPNPQQPGDYRVQVKEERAGPPPPGGSVIGNKNSKKYHLPGCEGYRSVSQKNQVIFKNEEEAIAAGYARAGNCKDSDVKIPNASGSSAKTVQTSTPTPSSPVVSAAPATQPEGQVIGNKNSKKYHLPGCPGYTQTAEKNRVYFKTAAEAEAAGYTKAGNCNK